MKRYYKLKKAIELKILDLRLKRHWKSIKTYRFTIKKVKLKSLEYHKIYAKLRYHSEKATILQSKANYIAEEIYYKI